MTPTVIKYLNPHCINSSIISVLKYVVPFLVDHLQTLSVKKKNREKEEKKGGDSVYILMTLMSSNPLEQAVPFIKNVIFLSCLSGSLD